MPACAERSGHLTASLQAGLSSIVGASHVLTGAATAGYSVDWTGRFRGEAAAVVRPADTAQVAAVPRLCTDAGMAVVPQGGGSISAEHGIGALRAPWLGLARSPAELDLFTRIRSALDPAGTLNPHILPR